MEKSNSKSAKIFTVLGWLLLLCWLVLIAKSQADAQKLNYIYDLPAQEIQRRLDDLGQEMLVPAYTKNEDNTFRARVWGFTGLAETGTLTVTEGRDMQVAIDTLLGDGKVGLEAQDGTLTLLEPAEITSLFLEAGSYDVYCVGQGFSGAVQISPA